MCVVDSSYDSREMDSIFVWHFCLAMNFENLATSFQDHHHHHCHQLSACLSLRSQVADFFVVREESQKAVIKLDLLLAVHEVSRTVSVGVHAVVDKARTQLDSQL